MNHINKKLLIIVIIFLTAGSLYDFYAGQIGRALQSLAIAIFIASYFFKRNGRS
jgi:hypothetical protein